MKYVIQVHGKYEWRAIEVHPALANRNRVAVADKEQMMLLGEWEDLHISRETEVSELISLHKTVTVEVSWPFFL